MTDAFAVDALSVRAGAKLLLDRISFSVAQGETIALVGPNGAGKSTLLRALAGEIAAHDGHVLLQGRAPQAWHPRDLALRRAVLSQNVTVTFPFTVAEIVRMGAGERRGKAVDAMADAALANVDLDGFQDRIIGTLSGGEQQRVHFARVMVQLACGEQAYGPGILLLDEPTASLDLRHQLDLVGVARQCAARGTTTIAIVHDLNLAALLADRVIVLGRGRIAADGAPGDTINDEILSDVFGVLSVVGRTPDASLPFVLPHRARKASASQ
jgi:iron complex transport system ATP-binding protein